MAEQDNVILARATYETLCRFLDSKKRQYTKDEEQLLINCSVRGEDLAMPITVKIYSDRLIAVLISHMTFEIPEDKRLDVAIAICAINNRVINGSFDYNIKDGSIYFRMSNSFMESELSTEVFEYMLMCSCSTIDEYNDKLLMLAKGMISLQQMLASLDSQN